MPYKDVAAKARYDAARRDSHREEINARQAAWARAKRAKRGLKPKLSVEERFWSKVEKTETCWLWRAAIGGAGYGIFGAAPGRLVSAHRFAYELAHGPIPDGLQVLHRCDVRACVRDEHHFLGTQADNVADAIAKGRFDPRGLQRRANGL